MKPSRQWTKSIVEEFNPATNTTLLSVAFTWHLAQAHQRAIWHRAADRHVLAGGPAVQLMPDYLADVATCGAHWPDAVRHHNPEATFTTRGCPRRCSFCAVPIIEGDLVELDDWPVRRLVCDNNLLAASRAHFDRVIDRLKPVPDVDFCQGLDARLLTDYHAQRLAELKKPIIRLAFDHVGMETAFHDAYRRLRAAGLAKRRMFVYVLIGHNDTPEDALYRLEAVRALKLKPNPMRYQPLDAHRKNQYVAPAWTEGELNRFMRYWFRLRFHSHIPFDEFDTHIRRPQTAVGAALRGRPPVRRDSIPSDRPGSEKGPVYA